MLQALRELLLKSVATKSFDLNKHELVSHTSIFSTYFGLRIIAFKLWSIFVKLCKEIVGIGLQGITNPGTIVFVSNVDDRRLGTKNTIQIWSDVLTSI